MAGRKLRARNARNKIDEKMGEMLDDLDAFHKFREEILPALRADMEAGLSSDEIYRKYESHLAARAITIALTEKDPGKALAAVKEGLDRGKGKAKERIEATHKYENLKDEELDALLLSRLGKASDDDVDVQ